MNLELDRFAHVGSPLARWDCRWKLGAAAVFVAATVSLRDLPTAVTAAVLSVGLVLFARLPGAEVFRRIRPVLIILAVIICVLAVTGGGPRVHLAGVPLSRNGLHTAGLVAAKALTIVLALVALLSTSATQQVLAAMRRLYVPSGLVQVFHLAYRYVFVIQSESRAVQTAMRARGFRLKPNRRSLGILGNAVGMLLIRSTERAERVYLAMQARGFNGSFPVTRPWRTTASDIAKFAALVTLSLALVGWDSR